jgi:DNA-binding PadR family transcriptional regulator
VSPVFRHGRLRLYLLKLLDEAPRHGYEVIRLLQDRFMGVYAPSPGTIYPRLARLEEDGLVTHEEVDGKKVYSITEKGREEIRSRLGDLADLEDELTESLRDVAREISVDVRDTVRSIREELASAAREFRSQDGGKDDRAKGSGDRAKGSGDRAKGGGYRAKGGGDRATSSADRAQSGKAAADDGTREPGADRVDEPGRIREEARRAREQMRADFRAQRARGDWAGWSAWSEWASGKDWATGADSGGGASSGRSETGEGTGPRSRRASPNPFSDLERIAIQFANELRAAAKQTGHLGERSLNDLRDILTDTLAKVRVEVFTDAGPGDKPAGAASETGKPADASADQASQAADAAPGDTEETR